MGKIKISPLDNVEVNVGGEFDGHKTANRDIKEGEDIIKYGYPIGHAIRDIKKGEHVHTDNIKTNLSGILEYKYEPQLKGVEKADEKAYFKGYVRDDGSVGIRNEIWIVNTVGCVNKTSELLAREANKLFEGKTDGIFNFVHPFGCSQLGDDQKTTQAILKGLVNHPNAAGVLVLGLGCENNNIPVFKGILGDYNPERIRFMSTQDYDNEVEEGLKLIGELVEYAQKFTRKKLISHGGSTILTEVPEMFGAETLLMNRCHDKETFDKTVDLINNFKEYFMRHNQVVYENPSPGNKKGGITTLEDKSLGCVQKSGTSDVVDVIQIGEHVKKQGLNLLTGPGNDIVAVTNLTASGCHLILFTTGRGTPLGAPVPTVKISSNSGLAERKPHWIDFNAGPIVDGEVLTQDLFDFVIDVANGRQTNNEKNGYREISIFKDGVVL